MRQFAQVFTERGYYGRRVLARDFEKHRKASMALDERRLCAEAVTFGFDSDGFCFDVASNSTPAALRPQGAPKRLAPYAVTTPRFRSLRARLIQNHPRQRTQPSGDRTDCPIASLTESRINATFRFSRALHVVLTADI